MRSLNLGALARAAKAHIQGGGLPAEIQAVGTDTRSLPSGSLFVALRGDRFDGHDYLEQAAAAGAVAAMVDAQGVPEVSPLPLLVVEDTLVGLGAVARHVRELHPGPTIGVTGSNGKTTTKELVAAALSPQGAVHKTAGNLNNRIGVPLTLFDWADQWAAVIEMGMNESGEIQVLAEMARPAVGVITVVGPAHIENLGTLENIARAKGELFGALEVDATAIVNADDPLIQSISVPLLRGQRTLSFGHRETADVRVVSAQAEDEGVVVEFSALGKELKSRIPFPGLHNAGNAAAALACAVALEVPVEDAAAALADTVLPGSRLVIR
ncbi:MAG: UDP-N-acetylmuramoyl-tripeptide--D-alanyl-D-alanine ligase, partial [Myxococcota bacterium]